MTGSTKQAMEFTQKFIDYALPLIQGEVQVPKVDALPRYAQLRKTRAAE